ncbi:hypothetical protein XENTR_v10000113 [Xenopus tropicalis]|nr:hypothetical protein XENTR_v10000113 [Xenopus tropicalis]
MLPQAWLSHMWPGPLMVCPGPNLVGCLVFLPQYPPHSMQPGPQLLPLPCLVLLHGPSSPPWPARPPLLACLPQAWLWPMRPGPLVVCPGPIHCPLMARPLLHSRPLVLPLGLLRSMRPVPPLLPLPFVAPLRGPSTLRWPARPPLPVCLPLRYPWLGLPLRPPPPHPALLLGPSFPRLPARPPCGPALLSPALPGAQPPLPAWPDWRRFPLGSQYSPAFGAVWMSRARCSSRPRGLPRRMRR